MQLYQGTGVESLPGHWVQTGYLRHRATPSPPPPDNPEAWSHAGDWGGGTGTGAALVVFFTPFSLTMQAGTERGAAPLISCLPFSADVAGLEEPQLGTTVLGLI